MNRTVISLIFTTFLSCLLATNAFAEGKMITFPTPDGQEANAYILNAKVPTTNYLFIFHEWNGLDDQTKKKAINYYNDLEGVTVIAVDLYDGIVAKSEEEAAELMRTLVPQRAENIVKGAIQYTGGISEISTLGWGMGATWALKASLLMGDKADGCVMYYGLPEDDVEKLKTLNTDVLFFHAKQDNWVTENTVERFRQNMKEADKGLEIIAFRAGQAFANPNDKRYDRIAAQKSYTASLKYLKGKVEN